MDNWRYHDNQMKKLKQLYSKTSKQTQNRLQEIIDTFKFNFDTLYNIADIKTKNRVNTYIEEWKDKGLLTGYFGTLAKNIYNRTRVKNSEILELLIYGAYIEEQNKLKEQELNIMYDDANYYYQEGQQEVNNTLQKKKKKPFSVLEWALFLALLDQPNVKGYIFEQYIQATIQFNAQQIYRQMTIDLQQQKQPDITNDIYQNLIKRQNNSKLNINGDKISGDIDAQLIGVNNLAKVEGIKEVEDNAQVKFIAVIDGKETEMCHSLDGQLFYINKENTFNRYYGETQKDLRIEKIKCFGLVVGLNLPPISHHFHWCRSTIIYQIPVENQGETDYNKVEYVRKNKITDNRVLDEKIRKVKQKFPEYIQDYINSTPIEIAGKNKNNHYLDGKLYLLSDATEEEIIHEIGHILEEKLDIKNDNKYQEILKKGIENIDLTNNCIGEIKGYDPDKYEFLLTGNKFISDYQRRVYNIDIDKESRINYTNYEFNYNVLRDYLPEGLRAYFSDKQLLKTKDFELYKYIEEVLNERK